MTARLGAGRQVVVLRQLAPRHARAVVDSGQRLRTGSCAEIDLARAGIQGVGDDLRENGFFGGTGVGIAQVFEQVQ
jgi:hypothetical protein